MPDLQPSVLSLLHGLGPRPRASRHIVETEKARSIGKKTENSCGYDGVAGPSTAPLAMKLQEAPLRMTVLL